MHQICKHCKYLNTSHLYSKQFLLTFQTLLLQYNYFDTLLRVLYLGSIHFSDFNHMCFAAKGSLITPNVNMFNHYNSFKL